MRSWWDIDFCSKKAYHVGDMEGYQGWYLLRDAGKLVFQKQFYKGSFKPFMKYP